MVRRPLALILLLVSLALAQTPAKQRRRVPTPLVTPVYTRPIQGNFFLPPGTPATNTLMRIQLVYCGGNAGRVPAAPGSPPGTPATIISFVPFDVRTQADGSWSTEIYGNDQIICGTDDQGNSRWLMKPVFNGITGPAVAYQIQSCGLGTCTPFSPDNAPQCGTVSPITHQPIVTDCAVAYPYTVPPPPPVEGPPGPPGPPGPAGPPGSVGGVNSGAATHVAYYATTGAAVNADPNLTDDLSTLSYTGDTYVSGSSTIDTAMLVQGPYWVDTPPASSPITAASAGRSAIGVSNDGNFYISPNAGTPKRICMDGDVTCNAGRVTYNGQLVPSGSSGNVNNGAAAHSMALNQGNGNAITGLLLGNLQFPVGATAADPRAFTLPVCSAGQTLTYTGGTSLTCTSSSSGKADQGYKRVELAADQSISANTNTNVNLSIPVTMPSGCPCRAFLAYGLYLGTGNSGIQVTWVNDGSDTHTTAAAQTAVTGSTSHFGINGAEYTSQIYNAGTSVTFQMRIEASNAGGVTVQEFSNNSPTTNEKSWMSITLFSTSNYTIP